MPPYTRSRRIDGFCSDTLITAGHLSRSTSYRTGINLDKHGVLIEVKIKRPNLYETECAIRIPMPLGSKNIRAVSAALVAGRSIGVFVLDTLKNRVFNRGPFVVVECTRTHFTVFKQWDRDKKRKTTLDGETVSSTVPPHAPTDEHVAPAPAPAPASASEHVELVVPAPAPALASEHVELVVPAPAPAPASEHVELVAPAPAVSKETAAPLSSLPGFIKPAPSLSFDDFFFLTPPKHESRGLKARPVTTKDMKNRFADFARPALQSKVYPPCAVIAPASSTSTTASSLAGPKSRKYFTPRTFSTPTVFQGTTYRSRLESRLAHLMSELKIRFVYEPMRYTLPSGSTYMIDFFLPDQQLYVELKPKRPHIEEEYKCEQMSRHGFRVSLLYGWALHKPPFRSETAGKVMRDYEHHNALRGMTWINGVKLPGDTVFVVGRHASLCTPLDVVDAEQPHLNQPADTMDTRWAHPLILTAMSKMDVV